jgi:drug/metabolite transporter (DMT)-like permease
MSPLATLLWAANLVCDVLGQLSFKAAAVAGGDATGSARWRRMLASRWMWIGIATFAAEFVLWLALLSLVSLSLAVLVGSADIVAVMIGGRLCFGEALTPRRSVAAVLIGVGVAMVGWG